MRATTASSPEKIGSGGTDQVASPAWPRLVPESPNDTRRRAREFATDQSGGTCEFVGDRIHTHPERVTAKIFLATVVVHRLHARDPYRNFGQAFTPGTAEAV